jgi:hypothetical protein
MWLRVLKSRIRWEEGALFDFKALGWCALAVIIASGLIDLFNRWLRRRNITRLLDPMRRNQEWTTDDRPQLLPESRYNVQVSESGVSCTDPDGAIESVAWSNLQQVEIVTTDHGPFLPDVFWVLHGLDTVCVVPQGATGDRELMERLQQLPGFRNEAVIDAMSSTDNRRFLCWEKEDRYQSEPEA